MRKRLLFSHSFLHWLTVLLNHRVFDLTYPLAVEGFEYLNRHFYIDVEKYDTIMGYRADDSYFSFAQDFLNGTISLRQLARAMHLGKPGQQYVIKSREAFDKLCFVEAKPAIAKKWFQKKQARDCAARRAYFDIERNHRQKDDLYILQLIDEEVNADDPRLRQNLS